MGWLYTDYSDEQIQALGDDVYNLFVQREAGIRNRDYRAERYLWASLPPVEDNMCVECYDYRRFPIGQRHLGYSWWRICPQGCPHEHHQETQ